MTDMWKCACRARSLHVSFLSSIQIHRMMTEVEICMPSPKPPWPSEVVELRCFRIGPFDSYSASPPGAFQVCPLLSKLSRDVWGQVFIGVLLKGRSRKLAWPFSRCGSIGESNLSMCRVHPAHSFAALVWRGCARAVTSKGHQSPSDGMQALEGRGRGREGQGESVRSGESLRTRSAIAEDAAGYRWAGSFGGVVRQWSHTRTLRAEVGPRRARPARGALTRVSLREGVACPRAGVAPPPPANVAPRGCRPARASSRAGLLRQNVPEEIFT